jgi:N-6 DNA Methylase
VLYAHPQAAGYDTRRFDPLFAAAFAQTLAFGLLLVREATDQAVGREAWQNMPPEHALMRTTLRVLSQEEIVQDVGVGFDVILDTVNSFEPAILARETGKRDPILYFYEDFLQVFDPVARERYGVYYTPVEVVTYMVAALDRALQDNLDTVGLTDEAVTMLDPATGTGTFLLGVIEHIRRSVESSTGPGRRPRSFARLIGEVVRIRTTRRPIRRRALPAAPRHGRVAGQATGRRLSGRYARRTGRSGNRRQIGQVSTLRGSSAQSSRWGN